MSRDSGETIFAPRHLDVSQGPLGRRRGPKGGIWDPPSLRPLDLKPRRQKLNTNFLFSQTRAHAKKRFKWFRFSVPAVPLQKGFFCIISVQFNRKGRFRFRFRFLENGSGGSGSAFGFGKTVPAVPVSGSGLVPEPPCFVLWVRKNPRQISCKISLQKIKKTSPTSFCRRMGRKDCPVRTIQIEN